MPAYLSSVAQPHIHIGPMHGGMTTGRPTGPQAQVCAVVHVSNEDLSRAQGCTWCLRVALQAEIKIALDQQLRIDRPVRAMANGATFTKRGMLEHKRPGLLPVALGAGFVDARHSQAAGRFENIAAMGVMALGAVHFLLGQRMMLRQMEFGLRGPMTFVTGRRIPSRVYDVLPRPGVGHVQAGRAMAGFATGQANGARAFQPDARVGAGGKHPANVRMAFGAGFIADERRAGNNRRH